MHIPEKKTEYWVLHNSECAWCSAWHKVTVQITELLYQDRNVFKTLSNWIDLQKEEYLSAGTQSEIFHGRGMGNCRTRILWQTFRQKQQKKRTHIEKKLEIYVLDPLKTTFWMISVTHRWTPSGYFIPKSGHYLQFSKR